MKRTLFSLLILMVLVFLTACSNTVPSAVSPSVENSNQPSTQVSKTGNNSKYVGVYYDELLEKITPYVNSISTYIKINQSDKDAMSMLRDRLKEQNIETGLVSINSELDAPGNLDYCTAVKTIDRDTVFLAILPSDLELADETERVQFVYLKKNEKIGLIAAKYSESNSYEWYENYLNEVYEYYGYTEYLAEYGKVIDKNKSRLDEIYNANEKIKSYIEDPPLMSQYLSDSEYDRVNGEFDRLTNLANMRIDRYNDVYTVNYDAQVGDYDSEIATGDELSNKYPDEIFYVEEYLIPNRLYTIQPPLFTPIPLPQYSFVVPPVYYTNADSFLAALANMINADDSYNQIPKPDKSQFRAERITDKNFIVNDFKIRW